MKRRLIRGVIGLLLTLVCMQSIADIWECVNSKGDKRFTNVRSQAESGELGSCKLLGVSPQREELKKELKEVEEQVAIANARKHLKSVTSFGYIYANRYHSGREKESGILEIDEEMSTFLRLRFQNSFAIPYKFVGPFTRDPAIGHLRCEIWLHGASYPMAYHIECILGAGSRSEVLRDATLGITSKDRANKDIQEALDRMVSKFARIFFRARGSP